MPDSFGIVGKIKCDCYINPDTKNKQKKKERKKEGGREEDGRKRRIKFSSLKAWINKYGLIVKDAVNI